MSLLRARSEARLCNRYRGKTVLQRILVIDDDAPIRVLLRHLLEAEGYVVEVAADGNEGIRQYRAQPADLVIVDMVMPGKEGIQTIMELKQEYPQARIIAISGIGPVLGDELLAMAQRLGARITLAKPIFRKDMLAAVKQVLAA